MTALMQPFRKRLLRDLCKVPIPDCARVPGNPGHIDDVSAIDDVIFIYDISASFTPLAKGDAFAIDDVVAHT